MPISRKKDSGNEVGVNVIIRVDFSCSVLDPTTTVTPFYTLTKLFYYQTFFKLGIVNIYDMNIKKMGSPYLFTLQQALKVRYFTGCAIKIRITFTQN